MYKTQNQVISNLRFPLCVLVVLIHTSITIDNNWVQITLSHVLSQVAVPSFFFFSGFLFFRNFTNSALKEFVAKLKRRCRSLLIPYVLWITVWLLIRSFFVWNNHSSILDYFQLHSWLDLWHLYWDSSIIMVDNHDWLGNPAYMTAPYLVPLWYLRDLIVVVLFTPIIFFAIKKFGVWTLVFFLCAYISHIWPIHTGLTIVAVFWFSFGAYFSIKQTDYVIILNKYSFFSYCITAILFCLEVYYDGSHTRIGFIIHPFFVISLFVSLISISSLTIDKWHPCEFLSQSSFFVYVAHGILIPYVGLVASYLFPFDMHFFAMLRYFFVPITSICLCLFCYWVLSKYANPVLKVLSGGR